MTVGRYARTPKLAFGSQYGSASAVNAIRAAIRAGTLPVDEIILRGAERLDTLAGSIYGDASYWWILAAASDVGWGLQLPPGTIVRIPKLESVVALVS